MQVVSWPDNAIDELVDYPFARHDVEIPAGDGQQLRVHLVDAGDPTAPVIVLLHGNPYRRPISTRCLRGSAAPPSYDIQSISAVARSSPRSS